MRLQDCAFLTNENLHPEVVEFLREQGHDVLDLKETGLIGAGDLDVIRRAHAEERVVLTHDRDFGRLVVLDREAFTGIVYLRPGHLDPGFTIGTLRALLAKAPTLEAGFIVVAQRKERSVQIRVRFLEGRTDSS